MNANSRQPIVRNLDEITPVPCPCGQSSRLINAADGTGMSLHITHMTDGDAHMHELTDELYYIIEGSGHIELDGQVHALTVGTAVYIPAGVSHRGWGDFRAVIVATPPFDPDDEISTGG